jgi:hypothetical protein
MAHGIYNKLRDFQKSLEMGWHKLTIIGKPTREDFPEIVPMPLYYNGGTSADYGNRRFFIPVAKDDMLPVAPPYCGETLKDDTEKGCEDVRQDAKDKRGTYILFTPREAWDWTTDVLAGTQYNVQSIGMLWNRSFWFISVALDELKSLTIGDGRKTDFNLNFSGGLDRSVSPQAELSSIVAVCHNTISLSRAIGKVLFHERATKHFSDRLEAAKDQIGQAVGMAAVFQAAMDTIAKNPCTPERAQRVFAGYLTPGDADKMSTRTRNAVDELTMLHTRGIGNRGETEFDMLNAYTQRLTHGGEKATTSMGRRFASSEFGDNADSKAAFLNLLTQNDEKTGTRLALETTERRGEKLLAVK